MTPEPVEIVKSRRDRRLEILRLSVPYVGYMGLRLDRRGDELTAILPFRPDLIGNPARSALHGGATAGFLELAAVLELAWKTDWEALERDGDPEALPVRLPKTINFAVDYLRPGLPRDAYARAHVTRQGRRYASVRVEAWQDNRDRPFAQGAGHFLMPEPL